VTFFGRFSMLAIAAAVAWAGASTAFGQAINTAPPPVVYAPPPVLNPSLPVCVPNSTNTGTPCSSPSTNLPPLTPIPMPVPQPPPPVFGIAPSAPSLAGGAPAGGGMIGAEKVVSYFQRGQTTVDTAKAFGFVVMPKSAVTSEEARIQTQFCKIMLASLDFVSAEAAAHTSALVTYWPLTAEPSRLQIEAAFATRDCVRLIAWYDHRLARQVAARADVTGLSGPFLITWPSEGRDARLRDPLIVDFAVADYARATKALSYWFGELRQKPELWTSRIREGTIRAELADAINDTAGVMVAVLAGKWESVTVVSDTP
jgi:hypothetical protein